MDVTESGMVIDVSEVHPENAPDSIDVTELPIVTDVILIPLNHGPIVGQLNVTEEREVHPENAKSPLDVNDLPIVTEASEVHPMNV